MEIKVSVISIGNDTAISLPNSAAKERESLTKRKKGLLIYCNLVFLYTLCYSVIIHGVIILWYRYYRYCCNDTVIIHGI